jgi:hypothetical protein
VAATEHEEYVTRLAGLRRSLELTDNVLSRRTDVQLKFDADPEAPHPAWCARGCITVAISMIPHLMSVQGLGTLVGLNYHELAHTIYSPQNLASLHSSRLSHALFEQAYHLLEESRIETLMAGRYAAVRKHFLFPVLTFLSGGTRPKSPEMFLLTYGRRYIPASIRDPYREFFEKKHGKTAALRFAAVIDKYRVTVLTEEDGYGKAANLVYQFAQLLAEYKIKPPDIPHGKATGELGPGAKLSGTEQAQQARDAQKAASQPEEGHEPQQGAGDDGPDSPDRGGAEDSASGAPHRRGGSDPAPPVGGDAQQHALGGGVGTEDDPDPQPRAPAEVSDQIAQELKKLLRDETVLTDVSRLRSAMNDAVGKNSTLAQDTARVRSHAPTAEMYERSDALYRVLQEMWDQIDSGWNHGQSEGTQLDMNRVFAAQTDEEMEYVYNSWDPGIQDSSGLEVVILGDESGSMGDHYSWVGSSGMQRYQIASQNIWELRYALDRVGAKSTALTFQTSCQTLYNRDETTDPSAYHLFSSSGGTNPAAALSEARRIFAVSDRRHKILVMCSDGDWNSGLGTETIVGDLTAMDDVVKTIALIRGDGARGGRAWTFQHQRSFDVVGDTTGDIFDIMAAAVIRTMGRIVG